MEKLWIDSEEGKLAVQDVQQMPEVLQVLSEAGKKQLGALKERVLTINVADASKDRSLIVAKAELDGAKAMLKCLIDLIADTGRPSKKGK